MWRNGTEGAVETPPTRALVIGYGNALRGDDAAGPRVVDRMAGRAGTGVGCRTERLLTPELAYEIRDVPVLILVDADAEAHEVIVEPVRADDTRHGTATHALSPGRLLGLCRCAYGRAPRTWLVRVPAREFDLGAGLSRGTAGAVEDAVQAVLDTVRREAAPCDVEMSHA